MSFFSHFSLGSVDFSSVLRGGSVSSMSSDSYVTAPTHPLERTGKGALNYQSHVASGSYDPSYNVLTLKVIKTPISPHGEIGEPIEETLCFEVTSLRVQEDGNLAPVEVLGARTDQVMQSVMGGLIESFKALNDANSLLNKPLHSGAYTGCLEAQECIKKVKIFSSEALGPSLEISEQFIDEDGELLPIKRDRDVTVLTGPAQIKNPQIVNQFLKAPFWKKFLLGVSKIEVSEHPFTLTLASHLANQGKMNALTAALCQKAKSTESNPCPTAFIKSLYDKSFEVNDQPQHLREKRAQLEHLLNRFIEIPENQQALRDDRIISNAQGEDFSFREYVKSVRQKISKLEAEEQRLMNAVNACEALTLFENSRNLSDQFNAKGKARFGALLSHQLHKLFVEYHLMDEFPFEGDREEIQHFLDSKLSPLSAEAMIEIDAIVDHEINALEEHFRETDEVSSASLFEDSESLSSFTSLDDHRETSSSRATRSSLSDHELSRLQTIPSCRTDSTYLEPIPADERALLGEQVSRTLETIAQNLTSASKIIYA